MKKFFLQAAIAFSPLDLTITKMDGGDISFDCQTLEVAGTFSVTVDNMSPSDTGSGHTVLLFEDANRNGLYDPGTDIVPGSKDFRNACRRRNYDRKYRYLRENGFFGEMVLDNINRIV